MVGSSTVSLGRTNEGLVSFAIGLAPAAGSLCHQLQEHLVVADEVVVEASLESF